MYYHLPMAKKKSALDRIPLRPTSVDQLNAQALTLLQQGQFQAGADLLRQSLMQNPRQPEAYYNFGFALQQLGLLDSAIQAYGQSIMLSPADVDALMARGNVFATQKRFTDAAKDFAKSVRLTPKNADAWNNLGNALLESERESEALDAYGKALGLRPGFAQVLFNKGKALAALERYVEAGEAYEAALKLNPDYEEAKWHLSWVRLILGDFDQGWRLFESRWRVAELGNQRRYAQLPQWLGGQSLIGKSLLLYNEQGLGDTLQFCRYIPVLQAMGAKVSLAVQRPLVGLLSGQWSDVMVAVSFADLSGFDMATPLMSLPLAVGTTLQTVPAHVPYIHVPEAGTPVPSQQPGVQPRIGIVWSGSTLHKNDKNRSMSLAILAPLFDLPVDWICLQPEIREADLAWLATHAEICLERPALNDFVETATLIAGLDLVVTVDTSVAHLAGAMGKPVWILLPTGCDYRWLLEREDSPWYPTARLFRQKERGNWPEVVARVAAELKTFFAARTDTSR
jgi:tetratricopeptide (TPR) repeat protein